MQIRFDKGPSGTALRFANPQRLIRADSAAEVPAALAELQTVQADGHWLAGYASYELGYALEPCLAERMPLERRLPLLCFGVYDAPEAWAAAWAELAPVQNQAGLSDLHPRWQYDRYREAFGMVSNAIGAGDIYQANLTFPIDVAVSGTSAALYGALVARQSVGHGALVLQDALPDLLSRSPELFFRIDAAGRIETRPMKGTQPRSEDPVTDAAARDFLRQDAKNRAENLMIVDLLRNDISRIAEIGSVKVPELFAVETYATVHQMVSTVEARLRPGTGLGQILQALFPCGSITGAPKIRAMEVLADLEPWARDIYCGSIGWMAPNGASEFNVAIRTLMVEDGRATLNVGGGVVWDSTAQSEYEEALWKARFAQLESSQRMPISA